MQICTGAVNLHSCVWICTLTANLHVNVSFSLLVVAFLLPWPRERSGSAATPSVQRLVNQPSYITICVTAVRDAARLSTPAPRGHPRRAGSRASGRYDPDPHLLLVQYFLCPLVLVKHSYKLLMTECLTNMPASLHLAVKIARTSRLRAFQRCVDHLLTRTPRRNGGREHAFELECIWAMLRCEGRHEHP